MMTHLALDIINRILRCVNVKGCENSTTFFSVTDGIPRNVIHHLVCFLDSLVDKLRRFIIRAQVLLFVF